MNHSKCRKTIPVALIPIALSVGLLLWATASGQAKPRPAQVKKTLLPKTFQNPILTAAADPFITRTHGKYFLLYTDVSGNHHITVRASASLATLGAAPAVSVYNAGGFFESPELFEFGKLWYIYYTQYPNTIKVLESDTDDPLGKYHYKATLTTNTYDGDLLKMPDGALYLLSSSYSSLRIQPLSNPYTVGGPQTVIAVPTHPSEKGIVEAPNALWHGKQLFVLYSYGNYNKDNYGASALRFDGGDPTQQSAWTKLPGPLLTESPAAGIWDAGVPSAFTASDGTQWFTYSDYSAPSGADPHRSLLVQPMRFDAQGNPVLSPLLPLMQPILLPAGEQ